MRNVRQNFRGFTLLELMIVISIIAILSIIGFSVYGPILLASKKFKAAQQVQAIEEACHRYFDDFGVYPPDTGEYEQNDPPPNGLSGDTIKYAIHRYLGTQLTDTVTGTQRGPYLRDLNNYTLTGDETEVDGKKCQLYTDPWGNPYQMDCMHFQRDPTTRVVTVSKPYTADITPDLQTLEVKVWSNGPDGKSTASAPFYPDQQQTDDLDNIMSWTKGAK